MSISTWLVSHANHSAAGNNKGLEDERGGPVLSAVLRYIVSRRPKVFVLENVKNLMSRTHAAVDGPVHQAGLRSRCS